MSEGHTAKEALDAITRLGKRVWLWGPVREQWTEISYDACGLAKKPVSKTTRLYVCNSTLKFYAIEGCDCDFCQSCPHIDSGEDKIETPHEKGIAAEVKKENGWLYVIHPYTEGRLCKLSRIGDLDADLVWAGLYGYEWPREKSSAGVSWSREPRLRYTTLACEDAHSSGKRVTPDYVELEVRS